MPTDQRLRAELEETYTRYEQALQVVADLKREGQRLRLDRLFDDLKQKRARLQDELVFTIVLVGQIKAGKSTLADVLFFDSKGVLPSGPTPTTSALTRINFRATASDEAIIHYYSAGDWKRIEDLAAKYEEERNRHRSDDEDLAAKGCWEMVQRVRGAHLDLASLLGNWQRISLSQLAIHIGADSVTAPLIHHLDLLSSEPLLQGIRVVDTPGLNDTVTSREKITRDSLSSADCVLFLTQAGHFLEDKDREILKDLQNFGIRHLEILASMFDLAGGEGDRLLRDFDRRVENQLGKPQKVLPVAALQAVLATRLRRGQQLGGDEQWYREHWDLGPDELWEASCIAPLRTHLQGLVAAKGRDVSQELRRHSEVLGQKIETLVQDEINGLERDLEDLHGDVMKVQEELARIGDTQRALKTNVLSPQLDQILELYQKALSDFGQQLNVIIKQCIDDCTALPISWGNKKTFLSDFVRNRGSLEAHLTGWEIWMGDDYGFMKLRRRLRDAIDVERVGAPRIVETLADGFAFDLAQCLVDFFHETAQATYSTDQIGKINEPAYEAITKAINGVVFNVEGEEREDILAAWRGLQKEWLKAGSQALQTRLFRQRTEEFFAGVFASAFKEEEARVKRTPGEKELERARIPGMLNGLREALELVRSSSV